MGYNHRNARNPDGHRAEKERTMEKVHIEAIAHVPVEAAWDLYMKPEHIVRWNAASEDWHTPRAENDPQVGGTYHARMEAKDGSMGFDLIATYTAVEPGRSFTYEMQDGREVLAAFEAVDDGTRITLDFDPEAQNPREFQQQGWQAILDNFVRYAEGLEA